MSPDPREPGTVEPSTYDEIEAIVSQVLDVDWLPQWWDTPLPRLWNATPRQILDAGDGDQLLTYVRTYLDPSFG